MEGSKAKGKIDSQYSRKTSDIRDARNSSGFFGKGNKNYKSVQKQQQMRIRGKKGV